MKHEERKRALAKNATPGPWVVLDWTGTPTGYPGIAAPDLEVFPIKPGAMAVPDDAEYIAFNDPTTALLEADKMEAGDDLEEAVKAVLNIKADSICGYEETLQSQ